MAQPFRIIQLIFITLLISTCNSNSNIENHNNPKVEYKKILMIGNSFTFYWNLPQVLEKMFEASGVNIKVFQKTIGGSKLHEHWTYHMQESYAFKDFDFVTFNEHSTYPLLQLDSCAKYIKLFSETAKNKNVKPYVYGTWEYPYLKKISSQRHSNTMQVLDSISDVNDATYVPVGEAFKYIENINTGFDLYMDDNKHPSPNGTYLIACVFYSMITGNSPIGLPRRFEGKNVEGKKIYYIITEPSAAQTAQEVAEFVTKDLR